MSPVYYSLHFVFGGKILDVIHLRNRLVWKSVVLRILLIILQDFAVRL